MTNLDWVAVALSAAVSLAVPLFLRPVLTRYGVVDDPNARSSHVRRTLRGGGVAPLLGVTTGIVMLLCIGSMTHPILVLAVVMIPVLAGLIGLFEDLRGLPIAIRASTQLLVGVGGAIALGVMLAQPWWSIALASVAIAAYVNIANFMDGLNGISGLHGLVTGIAYGTIGVSLSLPWLAVTGFVLAAAFSVFLAWNLLPPGLFLGDVGSYFLGAGVATLAVASTMAGTPIVTAVAPLAIYICDALATLVRRAYRGESILRPHRTHAYQRLTDTGLSHLQASTLVTGFTVATSLIGMLVIWIDLQWQIAALLIIVVAVAYLAVPRIRGSKLPEKPHLLMQDVEPSKRIEPREGFRPVRWIVLGATGFVGGALVEHLKAAGHETEVYSAPRLKLSPADASALEIPAGAWSDEEFDALAFAFTGADVVVNAAGLATPGAPADADLYGANVLLPALVARAADSAGVKRVIHLSSAAVQGRRQQLDETMSSTPFSPYSHSKALGERMFLKREEVVANTDRVVIRATSVQGQGRRTTESFRRIARSRLASVAAPGTQPTVVSSIDGLVDFIRRVSASTTPIGPVMLQPWEGYSVQDVLRAAGGSPRVLPRWLCIVVLSGVHAVGRVVPEVAGAGRRLEMMWLGQAQSSDFDAAFPAVSKTVLASVLNRQSDS